MENKEQCIASDGVPYIVYESAMARMERQIKRLFIICLVLIGVLVVTNGAWIIYENQFATTSVSQEVETGEGNATVIGVGDNYGEDQTDG